MGVFFFFFCFLYFVGSVFLFKIFCKRLSCIFLWHFLAKRWISRFFLLRHPFLPVWPGSIQAGEESVARGAGPNLMAQVSAKD